MRDKHDYVLDHDFYCTRCGRKGIPICRNPHDIRKPGHLKKLYCMYCGEEINHAECCSSSKYTYDDFLLEFDNGNFDANGNRILEYRKWRTANKDIAYV
jgi:transcription elongation factor Elf1